MAAKLRAGVIGLGMGGGHLGCYLEHPDVEVVAIADRREDRRALLPSRWPAFKGKVYHEGIDMIRNEKLDILSVAVPNNQHAELTIAGLEAGANVLCEKPMAMNAREAQAMLDTAKRCGKKLGIDFSYRFNPQSRAMKDLVEGGALGNIYYARTVWLRRAGIPGLAASNFNTGSGSPMGSWFFDKAQSGGGPLIDLGVHMIDLAIWLMGNPTPVAVSGNTYCKFADTDTSDSANSDFGDKKDDGTFDVEDLAMGLIRFDNGAVLQIEFSWASNIKEENRFVELRGTKSGVTWQDNEFEIFTEVDGQLIDIAPAGSVDRRGHKNNLAHYLDVVLDGAEPCFKPQQGVDMIKILCAIYESAKTGFEVKL